MSTKQIEALRQAREALKVAATPLAKDRQEVLRAQAAIREALAEQPERQPIDVDALGIPHGQPFQPAQPTKPLTDAQIGAVAADIWGSILIAPQSYQAFARAIEAAHGITGEQHGTR